MGTAKLIWQMPDDQLVKEISKLPGVRDYVRGVAGEVYWKAKANLAGHRDTGNADIEINEPDTYDHWGVNIWLVDEAALSIEFGHFVHNKEFPRFVAGLYILHRAAGLR
jgi:hypothetical protein